MKKQIGLYFGSFNPPHIGHMAIANYMLSYGNLDEVWFVVSPQNPLKDKKSLVQARTRFEMVRRAIGTFPGMRASDIEFGLPTPNYTINTLVHLEEQYPDYSFCLIMGMDNIQTFSKWKAWETLLEQYQLRIYPRPGYTGEPHIHHPHVTLIDAPLMEISSSFLRQAIKEKKNVRFFLPEAVAEMIEKEGLYQ